MASIVGYLLLAFVIGAKGIPALHSNTTTGSHLIPRVEHSAFAHTASHPSRLVPRAITTDYTTYGTHLTRDSDHPL